MKEEFMNLQHSESVIAQMSATVFAALIQRPENATINEQELINQSVEIAIKLAVRTDQRVKSDEEWMKKNTESSFLL
jgi:ABC-type sulfate transport system substrate-binding protein